MRSWAVVLSSGAVKDLCVGGGCQWAVNAVIGRTMERLRHHWEIVKKKKSPPDYSPKSMVILFLFSLSYSYVALAIKQFNKPAA